jgi:hypothetical protein
MEDLAEEEEDRHLEVLVQEILHQLVHLKAQTEALMVQVVVVLVAEELQIMEQIIMEPMVV